MGDNGVTQESYALGVDPQPLHSPALEARDSGNATLIDLVLGVIVACVLAVYALFKALAIGDACHRASGIGTAFVIFAPSFAWLVILILPVFRGQTVGKALCGFAVTHANGAPARWDVARSTPFLLPLLMAGVAISAVTWFSITPVICAAAVVLLVLTGSFNRRVMLLRSKRPTYLVRQQRHRLPLGVLQAGIGLIIIVAFTKAGDRDLVTCPPTLYILWTTVDAWTGHTTVVDYNATIVLDSRSGYLLSARDTHLAGTTPCGTSVSDAPASCLQATIKDLRTGYTFESGYETGVTMYQTRTGHVLRTLPGLFGTADLAIDETREHVFAAGEFGIWMLDARTGVVLHSVSPDDVVRALGHPIPTGSAEP